MKKALFIMAILLMIGLLVAGCSKASDKAQEVETQSQIETEPPIPDSPEEYVDEQIIDEEAAIEIGEMI